MGIPSPSCKIVVNPRDTQPVKLIATKVWSAESPGGTSKAGSILVDHDQDVCERRPREITPTLGLWHAYDVIWQPRPPKQNDNQNWLV